MVVAPDPLTPRPSAGSPALRSGFRDGLSLPPNPRAMAISPSAEGVSTLAASFGASSPWFGTCCRCPRTPRYPTVRGLRCSSPWVLIRPRRGRFQNEPAFLVGFAHPADPSGLHGPRFAVGLRSFVSLRFGRRRVPPPASLSHLFGFAPRLGFAPAFRWCLVGVGGPPSRALAFVGFAASSPPRRLVLVAGRCLGGVSLGFSTISWGGSFGSYGGS